MCEVFCIFEGHERGEILIVDLEHEELKALEYISENPRATNNELQIITGLSDWKHRSAINRLKGYGLINQKSPFSVKEHLQERVKTMLKNAGFGGNENDREARGSGRDQSQEGARAEAARDAASSETNQESTSQEGSAEESSSGEEREGT